MADKITKLAFEISNIKAQLRARATAPQLGNSSLENRSLNQYDGAGNLGAQFGVLPDGTNGAGSFTGPNPPQPSQPSCSTIPGLIEARWNGLFVDALSPLDLRHVAVYVVPDGGTIDLAHAAGTVSGELGDAAAIQMPIGTYQVYFVAWSLSGKWSVPSVPTTVVVPAAVDADSVADALADLNTKTDGLLTTAGELDTRLDTAETDLTAHETRLDTAETDLTALQDTTLPALDADLQAAKGRLTTAEGDINTAEASLATAQTDLNILKNTTVPNLNTDLQAAKDRLTTAEGDIDAAQTAISTDLPASIANVQAAADMALLIAPVSTAAPLVGDGAGRPVNSIWTRIDGSGNEIGYWRWTGTAWATLALTATVIPNLAASKITTGTLATARLDAASIAVAIASIIQLNADRITAGQLTSAQINTADLAAAIATIISLNADRITAGTISTARLDVSNLAVQIASIISLNASRITAGTIATARLDVTALAASIATIINLNADRITAGTIATARLNAVEIAAATASIQTADIKNLFVTTGTFTEAVINRLWVDLFFAHKITVQMLAVGAFDNICPDPKFTNTELSWGAPDSTYTFPSNAGRDGGSAFQIIAGGSQRGRYSTIVPLADETAYYRLSVWVKSTTALPANSVGLYLRPKDGTGANNGVTNTSGAHAAIPANTWFQVRSTRPYQPDAGSVTLEFGCFIQSSVASGTVVFSDYAVTRALDGTLVVDGSVTAASLTADAIDGKVITGATFQTDAAAGVGLKIDSAGFRAYGPEGGDPVFEVRPDGARTVGVTDPATGDALATLGSDGTVSGTGLNIEGDPIIAGSPLLGTLLTWESPTTAEPTGLLDNMPRGIIAKGTTSLNNYSIPDGERAFVELAYQREPGRTYKVVIRPISIFHGANAYVNVNVRATFDGSRPTLSSFRVSTFSARNNAGTSVSFAHMSSIGGSLIMESGASATTRLLFTVSTVGGNGTTSIIKDETESAALQMWVEDLGMSVDNTAVWRTDQIINGGTTTAPPPPPTIKNYTKTYSPNGARSYMGNGSTYNFNTSKAYQGQSPYSPNGILSSIITFPSMTGDLSGANITSIRAYFYFDFWYYNAGGTADIVLHGQSSLPSTKPTLYNARNITGWPKPGGMWVSIPSSWWAGFKSGTYRGVGLGDGTGGYTHYGYANWSKTRIEIKYTK